MAAIGTGIATEFESHVVPHTRDRRRAYIRYPKPGPSRKFFLSLTMSFPVSCMLWAAIVYGAVRLAR
jgi:hypothetical protein